MIFDVLVLGDLNPDIIVQGAGGIPEFGQREQVVQRVVMTLGGSAGIFSAGAARLGLRVSLISAIGADDFGRFSLDALRDRGVDVSHCTIDESIRTGASVVLVEQDDRAILTDPGAIASLDRSHVPMQTLRLARHVHVASYFLLDGLRPDVGELFDEVHAVGGTTSLDVNWDPRQGWDGGVRDVLPRTDIFFPNLIEAQGVTGLRDPRAAAEGLIRMGVKTVALKLGRHGGVAASTDAAFTAHAIEVDVADPIGAGDSFDAGFLAAWLSDRPLEEAIGLAVVCGSLSTRQVGGSTAQPDMDEARSWLERGGRVEAGWALV